MNWTEIATINSPITLVRSSIPFSPRNLIIFFACKRIMNTVTIVSKIDNNIIHHSVVCIFTRENTIASDIIWEGLNQIKKSGDVEIAYPHTQVLLPENKHVI